MKKFLALLLALCMMCAVALSGAEEAPAAVTVDVALTVDGDVIAAFMGATDESAAAMPRAIAGILNNVSIHGVAVGTSGEGSLNLKGTPVATFAAAASENGINVLSNLFPSSVLVIGNETLEQMTSSMTAGLEGLDAEAIVSAVMPKLMAIGEEAMSKVGEAETVTYTYEGEEFTTYQPLNMTAKEMSLLGLNAVKDILAEPAVQELTAKLEGFDASRIDEAIEKINNTPDEELPEMKAGMYSNEAGSMDFVVDLAKDEQAFNVTVAMLASGRMIMHMSVPGQADFDFSVNMTTGEIAMNIGGNFNGIPMTMSLQGTAAGTGLDGTLTIALSDVPVAALSIKAVQGGELTADFNAEGKTQVDFSSLMGDGQSEAAQALMQEIQTEGLQNVLGAAYQVMPEEIGALLGSGAEE